MHAANEDFAHVIAAERLGAIIDFELTRNDFIGLLLLRDLGLDCIGLGFLAARGVAGGFERDDVFLLAELGFGFDRVGIGAGFQLGVARVFAEGYCFRLGFVGFGFGLVSFGALTFGGIARDLERGSGLLFGKLAFRFLLQPCVVGDSLRLKSVLRVHESGRALDIDGEQGGDEGEAPNDPCVKEGGNRKCRGFRIDHGLYILVSLAAAKILRCHTRAGNEAWPAWRSRCVKRSE